MWRENDKNIIVETFENSRSGRGSLGIDSWHSYDNKTIAIFSSKVFKHRLEKRWASLRALLTRWLTIKSLKNSQWAVSRFWETIKSGLLTGVYRFQYRERTESDASPSPPCSPPVPLSFSFCLAPFRNPYHKADRLTIFGETIKMQRCIHCMRANEKKKCISDTWLLNEIEILCVCVFVCVCNMAQSWRG